MAETLSTLWDADFVVARGEVVMLGDLEGLLAVDTASGDKVGILGYRIDRQSMEVVTMNAFVARMGIGTALLDSARQLAESANLRRLWLVTTNDNIDAISFYSSFGMSVAAVHLNALSWSRQVKPQIPETGAHGIAVSDEIEFELLLAATGPPQLNETT
jgi:GNAT superfamily N-acetyltransferase